LRTRTKSSPGETPAIRASGSAAAAGFRDA
jgi:hypothetical protein